MTSKKTTSSASLIDHQTLVNAVVQHLAEIIWVIDKNADIIYASPSVEGTLGYTPEEMMTMNGMRIIHPDDHETARTELARVALAANDHKPTELRLLHKNGQWRAVEIIGENLQHDPRVNGLVITGRDVTDRKQAEERLKINECRYRDVVENANEGIVVLQGARVQFFNQKMVELFGYTGDDVQSRTMADFVHPDDLSKAEMRYQRLLNDEIKESRNVYRFIVKDGRVRWVSVNAVKIQWDGEPATLNFFKDVTEQRTAQKLLDMQYELSLQLNRATSLETIYDICLQAAMRVADVDCGVIYDVNHKLRTITLANQQDVPELVLPVISTYSFDAGEAQIILKGNYFFANIEQVPEPEKKKLAGLKSQSVFPVLHENYVIACLVLASQRSNPLPDFVRQGIEAISAHMGSAIIRARAHHALVESEIQFRKLAEHSPNMIFITHQTRILYVNQMAEKMLGYSRAEMMADGFDLLNIIAEDFHALVQQKHDDFDRDKHIPAYEIGLITRNGQQIDAIHNTSLIQYQGQLAMLGIVTDITDRKQHELQIERDLQEKEVLLKEIHHRVKNNLQVISSLLGLQSRFIKDASSLKLIQESQDRVRSIALVHENLYRSPNLANIDLNNYIRELIHSLALSYGKQSLLAFTHIEIEDFPLAIDLIIPCGLIINELVSNIFKYAFPDEFSEKPKISISIGRQKDRIEMRITDNGIGFDYDLQREDTRKTLGLKLVQILSEDQLQGTLNCTIDRGAKFLIQFNQEVKS